MQLKKLVNLILLIIIALITYLSVNEFDISNEGAANIDDENVKFKEKDYVNKYCRGYKEFVLDDKTRIDCLTEEYAIEFDYAKKWAESIGQALYYSKKTGKKPAVAIIISKPSDIKYVNRIKEADNRITIFEIPAVDFKE